MFLIIVGAGCVGLLGYGYYLEYFQDLVPCPMCLFQRFCYMAIAAVALIGAIHGPQRVGGMVYTILIAMFAAIGAGIAGRQTWLQHLPPDLVPECGPGLEFMLEMYPVLETIKRSLVGTGDCAEVSWTFLTLSIAEWSLVSFIGLIVVAGWQGVQNWRPTNAGA
jgi:disulfide bond formation protein DsbB